MKRSALDELIMKQENLTELNRQILEEIQLKKMNELLCREKERNGFYQLPAHISSLSDLKHLPFTTDEDLRTQYTKMFLGSSSEAEKIITGNTSGTTGKAKRIFYAKRDLEHTVSFFAAGIGEMAAEGEKVMIGMTYSGPNSLADLIAKGVKGCNAIPLQLKEGSLYEQCLQYHEDNPICAIDMPVRLLATARYYEYLYGKGSFPVKKILPSADACNKSVEKALTEEFGLILFPHYGSREMCMGGAITCQAHEGMHLREHQIIAEIVDEQGNVLPNGEWGELVITTVDMQVLPMIRFRTGDYTRFLKEPCPCGSVTRRLDRVSRKNPYAQILEKAENCFFGFSQIIDVSVDIAENRINLLVLPDCEEDVLKNISPEKAEVSIHRITETDHLFYSGKRAAG